MADPKNPEPAKTLEMRVSELEDKLSKMHITEEEMKTYQKVATALGVAPAATGAAAAPIQPGIARLQCYYHQCFYQQCYRSFGPCYECGGGCAPGGPIASGGGFGGLGS